MRLCHIHDIHCRGLDFAWASASPHYGGDSPLVQPVPFADRARGVSSLALPLGTSVRMPDGRDVRRHQHIQARDSHRRTYAGSPQPVVRPARHRLYVFLRRDGHRHHPRHPYSLADPPFSRGIRSGPGGNNSCHCRCDRKSPVTVPSRRPAPLRHPGAHGLGIHHNGHSDGRPLGQTGLG